MARVEESVEISAPRQLLWDLLADPKRHTELGTFVAEVTVSTPGDVREGTVYRERSGPGFMKSDSEWTITKLESPRQLIHETKEKSMIATATWTLSELGPAATRVTQVLDLEMMPRLRILGRLLEGLFATRMTQKETQRMLQDLKRLAEAP
jgi:carbon monoxide dehydrogenase subunit G